MTFHIPSHSNFKESDAVDFTVCRYDLHGSPDFNARVR